MGRKIVICGFLSVSLDLDYLNKNLRTRSYAIIIYIENIELERYNIPDILKVKY